MPTLETLDLYQKAVLWSALDTGNASDYDNKGERKVSAATEISVRWEDGYEETVDAQGNPISIDAKVTVNQDVPIGSLLWLGEQADLPSPATNLRKVVVSTKVPDLKNRVHYRELGLIRYSDSLPTVSS